MSNPPPKAAYAKPIAPTRDGKALQAIDRLADKALGPRDQDARRTPTQRAKKQGHGY